MAKRFRFDPGWILVLFLVLIAVAPLTYPGFFQAHSGFLPVYNVEHISGAPDWGRAADLMRGEGKLPYLLAWPAFYLTGSGVFAVRSGYALAFLLGALGFYLWTRHWLGRRGAVLASVVYAYLPWHLSTVYVRGAYAEAWLWALLPCTLWAIDRWSERRHVAGLAVGLLAAAGCLWTQPGLFALSVPILITYGALVDLWKRWPAGCLVAFVAAPLLLLWVLALILPVARPSLVGHLLYPYQLFSATWGDGLSFQVGLAATGLTIVSAALWLGNRSRAPGEDEPAGAEAASGAPDVGADRSARPVGAIPLGRAIGFWLAVLLVVLLVTLVPAALVWRASGFDAFLRYPWQTLTLAGLPLAFLAGSVVRQDERLAALPAWAGLVALVILASYPYLAPEFTRLDPGPEPVAMFQPAGAVEPQVMLLDYEISAPTEITPTLGVTLTWQAVAPLGDDYTVFVHILDRDGAKLAQRDSWPCDKDCATSTWLPGQILVDRHRVALPAGAPPGPYRLVLGFYQLDTGERVAVVGRDDETVVLDVP